MKKEEINSLIADRSKFNSHLYLSLDEALREVECRKNDSFLENYIVESLDSKIPSILKKKKCLVLFRHIATPNYEIARFVTATAAIPGFDPIILEFTGDRFLSRNVMKHALGKLRLQKGINKRGEPIIETTPIIDFSYADNIPISKLKTFWGQSLVDFHHQLFFENYLKLRDNIFDMTEWLMYLGGAKNYYKKFLTLFLRDAILFENFMLDGSEKNFTADVVIPAFEQIFEECGYKPLVVALAPTELEGESFWLSYPNEYKGKLEEHKSSGLLKSRI